MKINDIVVINGVEVQYEINNGECFFYKNFGDIVDFFVVIKSLDTELTANVMSVKINKEHNVWKYNWPVQVTKLDVHPGIAIEFYVDFNLVLRKNYRFDLTYSKLRLKSDTFDQTYPSYQTFFYDKKFRNICNIKDDDVVYDLGANIGAFSLLCSNYEMKQIYAFEPNPKIFKHLKYNCETYCKNTTLFEKAIHDKFEKLNFGNISVGLDSSSVSCSLINKNVNLCLVDGINLEKFSYVNSLELPTYLKVDIEGSEYDFFDSISDCFLEKCNTIFLEFHNRDHKLNLLIQRLEKLNYKLHFLDDKDYVLSQDMGTIFFIR